MNPDYRTDITGTVFDIERSATHDGPGIRTAVFLKGCYLKCAWCHNPESISPKPEILFNAQKCVGDLACYRACPAGALWFEDERGEQISKDTRITASTAINLKRCYDITTCTRCGSCADVCYAQALELVGEEMSIERVFNEIALDRAFYSASGGGITVTGGEPLFQAEFTRNLLAMCRANGIHTALDTTAYGPWDRLYQTSENADLVLLDLKSMDNDVHLRYTGVSNETILRNAALLAKQYAATENENEGIWIRIPIIPGINDSEANLTATASFVRNKMHPAVKAVELLGYHRLGVEKRSHLGAHYELENLEPPSKARLDLLARLVKNTLNDDHIRVTFR